MNRARVCNVTSPFDFGLGAGPLGNRPILSHARTIGIRIRIGGECGKGDRGRLKKQREKG